MQTPFLGRSSRAVTLPALAAVALLLAAAPAWGQINIVPNPGVENVDPASSALPYFWEYNKWGSASNAAFTWLPQASGNHTLHTQVFSGTDALPCSSGDAKWWTKEFSIYPGGGAYTVGNQYRSTVPSELLVVVKLSSGGTMYVTVATLPAAANWTTVSNTVNLPVATSKVQIMHKICATGWLETDNYTMYQGSGPAPLDSGVAMPDTVWPPPPVDAGVMPKADVSIPNAGAVISVVFDDGWTSVHKNALAIMKAQGIRATHFIHADYVDKANYQADYMTSTQLKEIYAAGHEIGSHAWDKEWSDKDEYLNAVTLDAQLQKSLNKLKGFGFNVVGFAPPGGEGVDNATVLQAVAKYYKYQRTIVWGMNNSPYSPYQLKSQAVLSTTTLATLQSWVAQAKANNSWLVLLYHRIQTPTKYETEVTPLNFIDQLGVLKASGLPVKPMGEVLGVWTSGYGLTDAGTVPTGDASTTTGDSSTADLGGSPWGDYTVPFPGPDAGFPSNDLPRWDQNVYSMPRPRGVDSDGVCSLSGNADSLPGLGIVLLIGFVLLRRRRRG